MARINEHESVSLFREYLRIPSVQPDVNYGKLKSVLSILVFFKF